MRLKHVSRYQRFLVRVLTALTVTLPAEALAQDSTATLFGEVRDSLGARLVNAQVAIGNPRRQGTLTDSLGRFRLETVPPGDIVVETGAIGYERRWHHVHLMPGQLLQVTLVMGPPISLPEDPVVIDSVCNAGGCRKP
jgi:hypothetical protein